VSTKYCIKNDGINICRDLFLGEKELAQFCDINTLLTTATKVLLKIPILLKKRIVGIGLAEGVVLYIFLSFQKFFCDVETEL